MVTMVVAAVDEIVGKLPIFVVVELVTGIVICIGYELDESSNLTINCWSFNLLLLVADSFDDGGSGGADTDGSDATTSEVVVVVVGIVKEKGTSDVCE